MGGFIYLTGSVKSGQEIHINHSGVGGFEPPWPNSWFFILWETKSMGGGVVYSGVMIRVVTRPDKQVDEKEKPQVRGGQTWVMYTRRVLVRLAGNSNHGRGMARA